MKAEVLKKEEINIVWIKRDIRTQDHLPLQYADAGMMPPGGDMGLAGPPPGGEEMPPTPDEMGAAAPAASLGRERR